MAGGMWYCTTCMTGYPCIVSLYLPSQLTLIGYILHVEALINVHSIFRARKMDTLYIVEVFFTDDDV